MHLFAWDMIVGLIMESFIGENSFISLLGIDGNSGKILDKEIEHIFIERMKLKE